MGRQSEGFLFKLISIHSEKKLKKDKKNTYKIINIHNKNCPKITNDTNNNKHNLFQSTQITNDRSYLLLNSRLKTKQNYILITSILSRHLANSFDS